MLIRRLSNGGMRGSSDFSGGGGVAGAAFVATLVGMSSPSDGGTKKTSPGL